MIVLKILFSNKEIDKGSKMKKLTFRIRKVSSVTLPVAVWCVRHAVKDNARIF
jgi:hypothetical protein